MAFCIPKHIAANLKQAAARGEINIAKMYEMTSAERRELFEKYTDVPTAREINTGFENAMVSNQVSALKKWAEATFTATEKKTQKYKDVIDKIDNLNETGLLTPESESNFMEDLVASKLGAVITSEEAKTISEKANKLKSLADKETEFGTPTLEYFKAKRDLENYLDSITPSSRLRVATSTIGRGNMLTSLKSPLLNIESNTVMGLLQALERRLTNLQLNGSNGEYASKYAKYVNQVFKETGYDISRMQSLDTGRRTLGEDVVNTQGEGTVRKVGRVYEDLVFKKMLSAPDVAFSSAHFADSANLMSAKLAGKEGKSGETQKARALEIFKDATRISPKTIEGEAVRAQAIADATYATYTNESVYSTLGLGIRRLFNIPSKDLRVGDQIMPFVKTPANVIGAGIESSGVLIPFDATMRMVKTIKAVHEGTTLREAAGENFAGFARKMVRAGLGMTFAYLLSTLFDPEDFMGEYPVSEKERKLMELKNATPNSLRIGGKWVSLDYFGVLGAPLVGFLYAKKYGKNLPDAVVKYYRGVVRQSAKIPGFDATYNMIQALKESRPAKEETVEKYLVRTAGSAVDFVRARVIPGIVYDVAKATDQTERKINYDSPTDKLQSSIPLWRQSLPEKYNVFGESIKTEGWGTLLFGARVKTAADGPILKELVRMEEEGNLPSITDVSKRDSAIILKSQLGQEKFDEAIRKFGTYFKQDLTELINSSDYAQAENDDERKKWIEEIKNDAYDYILDEYGYFEPDEEQKKKILGK